MIKKVTKEETPLVEKVVEETTPVVEVQEEIKEVVEKVVKPLPVNEIGVRNIVQKIPSGYKLLLETGETIKVSKDQYKKGQKTIIL